MKATKQLQISLFCCCAILAKVSYSDPQLVVPFYLSDPEASQNSEPSPNDGKQTVPIFKAKDAGNLAEKNPPAIRDIIQAQDLAGQKKLKPDHFPRSPETGLDLKNLREVRAQSNEKSGGNPGGPAEKPPIDLGNDKKVSPADKQKNARQAASNIIDAVQKAAQKTGLPSTVQVKSVAGKDPQGKDDKVYIAGVVNGSPKDEQNLDNIMKSMGKKEATQPVPPKTVLTTAYPSNTYQRKKTRRKIRQNMRNASTKMPRRRPLFLDPDMK